MKETQLKIVKDQLLKCGEVSRNWCLSQRLTRLASRILDLKKEGWTFKDPQKRNGDYFYILDYSPEKKWREAQELADYAARQLSLI
jgi:hypothetical protein